MLVMLGLAQSVNQFACLALLQIGFMLVAWMKLRFELEYRVALGLKKRGGRNLQLIKSSSLVSSSPCEVALQW